MNIEPLAETTSVTLNDNVAERSASFRLLDDRYYPPGFCPIVADGNDPQTIRNGFAKRLCRVVPAAQAELLAELTAFVNKFLKNNFKVIPKAMDYDEWRASLSFNNLRLSQLDVAHEELHGGRPIASKMHHIQTHMKREIYHEFKNARLINSRCDQFKVWFGPICKTIEKCVYQLPWFVKDIDMGERVQRILSLRGKGHYIYTTDFTAFESHFTPEVMWALEFQLYKHFMPEGDFDYLVKIIGGRNKMKLRNKYKAECDGRRMSGEMSTSLANGFSNLMLAMFLIEKQGGHFNGCVEGDDGLFVTDVPLDDKMYSDLGFTIKIKRERDICEAAFCGLIISDDGQLIKDPRRIMQRFAWTLDYLNARDKKCKELLRAKALSLYYELPQCPILGVLARVVIAQTAGIKAHYVEDGYHVAPREVYDVDAFEPTFSTRELFSRIFGVDISLQVYLEKLILQGRFNELSYYIGAGNPQYSVYGQQSIQDMELCEQRYIRPYG